MLQSLFRYAVLPGQVVLKLACRMTLAGFPDDLRRQLRGGMRGAFPVVRLPPSWYRTRHPCPGITGNRLAHRTHIDAELGSENSSRLAGDIPSAALDHDLLREARTLDPLTADKRAIPEFIRAAVLGLRSVGQVDEPVIETASGAMTDFLTFRRGTDERFHDELMYQPGSPLAVPVKADAQMPISSARHCGAKQAPTLSLALASVEAANLALVTDCVQSFVLSDRPPVFGRIIIHSHYGLLGGSWRSGPGNGVVSAVRAAFELLLIIANSLGLSVIARQPQGGTA